MTTDRDGKQSAISSVLVWLPAPLVIIALSLVALTRSPISAAYSEIDRDSTVYAMPQNEQLIVLSLGYRAALADLLFGKTMVAVGTHFAEHRVFHHLDSYLEGILTLDSRYRDVYRYADTMLNLSTVEMPKKNLRIARDILEGGLEQFPSDAELWMNAGLFVAYVAPQRLPDNEDEQEWKAAGARMIGRACDVWPSDKPLPTTCFASSSLLHDAGHNEAAIARLERMMALSDDPKVRGAAAERLEELMGEQAARRRQQAVNRTSLRHARDLPSVSRTQYQLLSPNTRAHECSGPRERLDSKKCASSFAALGAAHATNQ